MNLNFYKLKVQSPKIKRLYFYNPNLSPELFARNLRRANNLHFKYSKDLVWIELPEYDIRLTPKYVYKMLKETEIVEDEELFVKTIYGFISKLFKDNNFVRIRQNEYISLTDKFPVEIENKNIADEVSWHVTYKVKLYKIDGTYLLTINPGFCFLSTKNALEAKIKGAFVLNIISGRTFPYKSGKDGKLIIEINEAVSKEVQQPENYFFNYSMVEAKNKDFSEELPKIYKTKFREIFENMNEKLHFLEPILDIKKPFEIPKEHILTIKPEYEFRFGVSQKIKDIFTLRPYDNSERIKLAFLFKNNERFKKYEGFIRKFFGNKKASFYELLSQLDFKGFDFLRNPKTKRVPFFYEDEDFKEIIGQFSKDEKVYSIIILEPSDDLHEILEKIPDNFISLPILKLNLLKGFKYKPYIIRSFVYKFINFAPEAQPYILRGLSNNTLYFGFDTSHSRDKRKSNAAFAGVDNLGKVIYINKQINLDLNEKLDEKIIIENCVKAINRYKEKRNVFPENVFVIRDGIFREEVDLIMNNLSFKNIKTVFVEINKNCNINSSEIIKGNLIKLTNDTYAYFHESYNHQKGVEIKILANNTNKSNSEIAKEIYLTTRLFHQTPYTNLKLPFPLYITDKVSLNDLWKLYIPYFN
ncbi:MAG: hypothetical protein PWQ20_1902 [Thermotogaceae bacterium]|jgi:hypothetical protein|nr:hypothetical protein [Thermotogaceae bacterium]